MPHPLVPVPTPETRPFWDAASRDRLHIPRCVTCDRAFFPPSPVCPHCTSRDVEWFDASGKATLYSFVIHQRPHPLWETDGPRSVALVRLAEGPMLVSSIVDCPQTPEALVFDMDLRATFRPFGGQPVLCFTPARNEVGA
jgi:uncharacterized protein